MNVCFGMKSANQKGARPLELTISPFGTSITKHTIKENLSLKTNTRQLLCCNTTLKKKCPHISTPPFCHGMTKVEEGLEKQTDMDHRNK